MKKCFTLILLTALVFIGCNKDDDNRNNNPFLPNYSFSIDINMELPQYASLQFAANAVYANQGGAGINDVIIMNTGSGFTAFEATCPNQPITECSFMDIQGINAICPCDDAEYSLFTGLAAGQQYPLKQYRVTVVSPTFIRVSN
ncbi:MAG: Rieske (2Fe-2S) protein [Flavobacterium sp.]